MPGLDGSFGARKRSIATAISAPVICAAMKRIALDGAMPVNVLVSVRAIVTAGFAKLVEEVKK